VRVMAAQASLSAHKRPVHPAFAEVLVHHIAVASPAQLVTGFLCPKGLLRTRLVMTLVAHLVGDRFVHIIIKNAPCVGTVRVVACGTLGLRNRIVHMLLNKRRGVGLVALHTESRDTVGQQGTLCRPMGIVTANTPLRNRGMLELGLFYGLPYGLVAAVAEVIAGLQEVEPAVGRMGVVTFYTAAFNHHLMGAYRIVRHHRLMTPVADLFDVVCKQLPMGRRMGVVTAGAFPGLHRRMEERFFHLILKVHMAGLAVLSLCAGLEFELVL